MWYELVDNQSYDNNNRQNTFGLLHSDATWTAKPAYNVFRSKVTPVAALDGNPGFESGVSTPWTNSKTASVVASNSHTGAYAADLGGDSSGIAQTVGGLAPNTSYTLTAWVKTQADLVYLGVKNFAGAGTEVNTTTTAPDYTRLSVSFTTRGTVTSAYIFLWKSGGAGLSYADDVKLTAAANP